TGEDKGWQPLPTLFLKLPRSGSELIYPGFCAEAEPPEPGASPRGRGDVCVWRWKTSGSILMTLLIELETKQFSLALSKIRGSRAKSLTEAITTFGLTTISVIW